MDGDLQYLAAVLLRFGADVISAVAFSQRSLSPEEREGSFKIQCFERDARDAAPKVRGTQPRPWPAWRCCRQEAELKAEGNFRQCAKCGDIASTEIRMSAKIVLNSRFVTLHKAGSGSLEVFRMAAVAKMRCAWQQWHRPQTQSLGLRGRSKTDSVVTCSTWQQSCSDWGLR